MAFSRRDAPAKIVVDSIHGDIPLTDQEWRIVDTGSFQRLRHIKQLGMAQLVYPGATHTRFSHSLGVLGIMKRILELAKSYHGIKLGKRQRQNLRLAALLHDIGHYPYSHLMEGVDNVQLIEEMVGSEGARELNVSRRRYPKHVAVGRMIVTQQRDLVDAIGSAQRARQVAALFERTATPKPQLSKLVNSSLDMDRLDYLLRDSRACGVPFGHIDINYLLNNLKISPSGMVGVLEKALPAAEQFLFARYFMHRAVYYHKTTFGFEEACRQLLRRVRDAGRYGMPPDGKAIESIVESDQLGSFTDAFVDDIVQKATGDQDEAIRALATAIQMRRPPRLLAERPILEDAHRRHHAGSSFCDRCRYAIARLAGQFHIPLGQFMLCTTRPLSLEERGARLSAEAARELQPEHEDQMIKIFVGDSEEPTSLVDIDQSLANKCSSYVFQAVRLYVVYHGDDREQVVAGLRDEVKDW